MSKSQGRRLRLSVADIDRWRSRVVVTAACHLWMGAVGSDGYGRFSIRDGDGERMVTPHQVAARLTFGPLSAGSTLLHDCDVRVCVATATGHVRVATQTENMVQAARRGRAAGPHPGLVDTRGKVGASRAVQTALRDALEAGITGPVRLAAVLSEAVRAGDPYRQLVPLFPEPEHQEWTGWDDFPIDLLDPRAAPVEVQAVDTLPLFW